MELSDLSALFGEARRLTDHKEFVVVGSLSILGLLFFLDPNDAAVSKYARSEPRDREWIQAGLRAGVINAAIVASRFRDTAFLDADEQERALRALAQDQAQFGRPRTS